MTNITDITLKFTPYSRAKLQFICDHYDHEVGAMGIAATADPFLVTDLFIPKQKCSPVFVEMDSSDIADSLFMTYCDPDGPHKLKPHQVGRIFIHTHPTGCLDPSPHDETIFAESFGSMPWAMMVILPKGGRLYARVRVSLGNDINLQMRVADDLILTTDFKGADHAAWKAEIDPKITEEVFTTTITEFPKPGYKGTTRLPSGYWGKQLSKKQQKRAARAAAQREAAERQETIEDAAKNVVAQGEEELSNIPFPFQQDSRTTIETEDNSLISSSKYVDAIYSEAGLRWVPPCTAERIAYLKDFGFTHVIDDVKHTERFTIPRGDTFYDLSFKQAWAFVDEEENLVAEREDFERAMHISTHMRKYGDLLCTGDYITNTYKKVKADCLWQLKGSTDASDALVLTRDEMLIAEQVVAGKLTADEALNRIPDVVDEQEVIDSGGVFMEYCSSVPEPTTRTQTEEEYMLLLGEQ